MQLDLDFVRSNFPAFSRQINEGRSFFENAGGSFACRQTIDAMHEYYTDFKVQPYSEFESSRRAGELMDRSRERWAEALGVEAREVVFGPSTSANTYVLAHAFADVLDPGNEVIVTNQDHEANTGAIRRAAERVGCTIIEWRTDPITGKYAKMSRDFAWAYTNDACSDGERIFATCRGMLLEIRPEDGQQRIINDVQIIGPSLLAANEDGLFMIHKLDLFHIDPDDGTITRLSSGRQWDQTSLMVAV